MAEFRNSLQDYSTIQANTYLTTAGDAVSSKFHEKLRRYRDIKLKILTLDMKSELFCEGSSVYTGSSGLAFYYLMSAMRKKPVTCHETAKVINSILTSGKKLSAEIKAESPLMWQWHDKIYLGAAHGYAGILYMLLQARAYIDSHDMDQLIRPTIDWLTTQRFEGGNFSSSLGSKSGDRLVQWCHGAPGFVPLYISAYQVFEDKKYLDVAIKCGEVIWERGLCRKGYSICHGVSGNAYAFLQLYQVTKEPQHLHRACAFMEWCMDERPGTEQHKPDRPASLFEGLLGRIYLAEDIMDPLNSKFPAFCL
ncbi:lanC-like protein 2 isoform X2 [Aricia agestis]|uniref:lanC-like protein 2 isoform X2 n=1 Tax=Aricia agestis TaxID=91739 RepID=UPI001C2086CC|nr:lanC-like protein 2 isoform X2 [Aricia agestis]